LRVQPAKANPAVHHGLDTDMTNDLIAAIKRDFDRDGFVILRGYLCGRVLVDLRERATRLAADLHERVRSRKDLRNGTWHRSGRPMENRDFGNVLKNLQDHDAWFDHELEKGRHVGLVLSLIPI